MSKNAFNSGRQGRAAGTSPNNPNTTTKIRKEQPYSNQELLALSRDRKIATDQNLRQQLRQEPSLQDLKNNNDQAQILGILMMVLTSMFNRNIKSEPPLIEGQEKLLLQWLLENGGLKRIQAEFKINPVQEKSPLEIVIDSKINKRIVKKYGKVLGRIIIVMLTEPLVNKALDKIDLAGAEIPNAFASGAIATLLTGNPVVGVAVGAAALLPKAQADANVGGAEKSSKKNGKENEVTAKKKQVEPKEKEKEKAKVAISDFEPLYATKYGDDLPIANAAFEGDIVKLRRLLDDPKEKAKINHGNSNGNTALVAAAMKGHEDIVQLLIENGADVNLANQDGYTALHAAIVNKHPETARILLNSSKIDLSRVTKTERRTTLFAAVEAKNHYVARLIVAKKNAPVNQSPLENGATPLMMTVENDDLDMMDVILGHNDTDVNLAMLPGNATVLHMAAQMGREAAVTRLLACPDIDVTKLAATPANKMASPIEIAASKGNIAIAELLADHVIPLNYLEHLDVANSEETVRARVNEKIQLFIKKHPDTGLNHLRKIEKIFDVSRNGVGIVAGEIRKIELEIKQKAQQKLEAENLEKERLEREKLEKDSQQKPAAKKESEPVEKGEKDVAVINDHEPIYAEKHAEFLPLIDAVMEGDIEKLRKLLNDPKIKKQINYGDGRGYTALYAAASEGHADIIELLKQHEADPNLGNEMGITPLIIASGKGNIGAVQALLGYQGIQINQTMKGGGSPLYSAAQHGHESIVQLLIDNGADVNLAEQNGFTPLHTAVNSGNTRVAQILVNSNKIDLSKTTKVSGKTTLFIAVEKNLHDVVRSIVAKKNAPINQPLSLENGITPLMKATENGDIEMMDIFLKHEDIDVNFATSLSGTTALHLAAQTGDEAVIKRLLACPDIDVTKLAKAIDGTMRSPIEVAADNEKEAIVRLLVNHVIPLDYFKRFDAANVQDRWSEETIKARVNEKMQLFIKKHPDTGLDHLRKMETIFDVSSNGVGIIAGEIQKIQLEIKQMAQQKLEAENLEKERLEKEKVEKEFQEKITPKEGELKAENQAQRIQIKTARKVERLGRERQEVEAKQKQEAALREEIRKEILQAQEQTQEQNQQQNQQEGRGQQNQQKQENNQSSFAGSAAVGLAGALVGGVAVGLHAQGKIAREKNEKERLSQELNAAKEDGEALEQKLANQVKVSDHEKAAKEKLEQTREKLEDELKEQAQTSAKEKAELREGLARDEAIRDNDVRLQLKLIKRNKERLSGVTNAELSDGIILLQDEFLGKILPQTFCQITADDEFTDELKFGLGNALRKLTQNEKKNLLSGKPLMREVDNNFSHNDSSFIGSLEGCRTIFLSNQMDSVNEPALAHFSVKAKEQVFEKWIKQLEDFAAKKEEQKDDGDEQKFDDLLFSQAGVEREGPGHNEAGQIDPDEALARQLQEQFNAEQPRARQPGRQPRPGLGGRLMDDGEDKEQEEDVDDGGGQNRGNRGGFRGKGQQGFGKGGKGNRGGKRNRGGKNRG